jgi:potassium transporter
VTYYVGHETVTRRQDGGGLPRWQEEMFAFMERNASHVTDYFNLPSDQVVEIGRQIAISQACRIGYGQGCPVDAAHKMRGRWTGTRRPSTIAARML